MRGNRIREVKFGSRKKEKVRGPVSLNGMTGRLVDIADSVNAINPINFYPVKYFVEIELALLNLF